MLFITVSPIPASLLLLLVISHFEGFLITLGDSEFPLYGLLVIIGTSFFKINEYPLTHIIRCILMIIRPVATGQVGQVLT